MSVLSIREALPADAPAVRTVVEAAFGQPDEADLVDTLVRDGDVVVALLAEAGGEIVGHALLSRMDAPFTALALAPVSVSPAWQGRGVGQALVRAALAKAAEAKWLGVFVLGDNVYYGRFGFEAALAAGFASPYAGPHFMALALGGPLPATCGVVRHAAAFG